MKRVLTLLLIMSAALAARAASPTLSLHLDRARIYEGESVVATVTVEGSRDAALRPSFPHASPARIAFLGSNDRSETSITVVNGRMQRTDRLVRSFVFEITPAAAGTFRTGPPTIELPGGQQVRCPGGEVEVVGVMPRDDIEAAISCEDRAILVDGTFRLTVGVAVRALPKPNDSYEPVWPQNPLHLQADFLDFGEIRGLKGPTAANAIGRFVTDSREAPAFTINGYSRSAGFGGSIFDFDFASDPMRQIPIQFRFPPEKEDRGGTNWWRYSFSLDYAATAEGDYTFGPLTVKGSIVTGPNPDGSPHMEDVFVVGPAVTIRVIPPPEEGRPDWFSGGVGRSLSAKATLSATSCKLGDPLALTLDLTGDVSAENLRPPVLGLLPGVEGNFRVYDEAVESESIPGGKRFRYRVRPIRPGTLEFPAIRTAYYDSRQAAYVTVESSPLPLQVEATTQIAAGAPAESSADAAPMPDAILWEAADDDIVALPGGGAFDLALLRRRHGAWFWLPPLVWLAAVLGRRSAAALRKWAERTRPRRRAASARRRYAAAARAARHNPGPAVDAALSAARTFFAAALGAETPSLTAADLKRALEERGVDAALRTRLCDAFGCLEGVPYRQGDPLPQADLAALLAEIEAGMDELPALLAAAARPAPPDWRAAGLVAACLLLGAQAASGGVFERPPDAFDWERVQNAFATASTPDDFARAADLCHALATNGAASGPLYHNLGTALLLAGQPRAAAEAFDVAARWRGLSPEVRGNRLLAEKALSGSTQLPPERYFLAWHYWPSAKARVAAAAACWALFWACLAVAALAPRRQGGGRLRQTVSTAARLGAALAAAGLLLFGPSMALTFAQSRNVRGLVSLTSPPAAQDNGPTGGVEVAP